MHRIVPALIVGILFGAGLALSDMVNPGRVLAFLDLFGEWDPSLAFVMGGALFPASIAYALSRGLRSPLLSERFHIPDNRAIDRQLILGGLIFGAGWGLVGYCPGPAIAGLAFGTWQSALFCIAMLAGMGLQRLSNGPRTHRARSAA